MQTGFQEVPLRPGSIVWFTPGLIHRLINHDGRLEIYVVMENGGLTEHGDSLLTFAPHYLKDERAYLDVASLSPTGAVFANSAEAAAGSASYLSGGTVCEVRVDPEHETRKLGFCGTLRPYFPEGVKW